MPLPADGIPLLWRFTLVVLPPGGLKDLLGNHLRRRAVNSGYGAVGQTEAGELAAVNRARVNADFMLVKLWFCKGGMAIDHHLGEFMIPQQEGIPAPQTPAGILLTEMAGGRKGGMDVNTVPVFPEQQQIT